MKENPIKGVITEILETKERKSGFEVFLNQDQVDLQSMQGNEEVAKMRNLTYSDFLKAREEYKEIINDPAVINLFESLRLLEIKMIQSRCVLNSSVKLGMVNQKRGGSETSYIIARAAFYNPDNVKPEIRVYLGKTSEIGRSLEDLGNDREFMADAEKQIVRAMKEVMEKQVVRSEIKKTVGVKESVSSEGEVLHGPEIAETPKPNLRSPYNPGAGKNPKPKGGLRLFKP